MEDDRTAYLAAIKETCNRQVEEEAKRIKQHFEDKARISKQKYESDVEKQKAHYEELIRKCQEDLQREYNLLLGKELEIRKRELGTEHEERMKMVMEESKRIRKSLEEEARYSKKNYQCEVKKKLKAHYEGLIRQSQEDLHREYSLVVTEKIEIRERELTLEHDNRIREVIDEYKNRETDLRLQLVAMEQKSDDTLNKRDRQWNEQVNELLSMLTIEAEEKVRLDMTALHEQYNTIYREKEALISSLSDDKVKVISAYELLAKQFKELELEKSDLKSKVNDLLAAESSYVDKLNACDQETQKMMLNVNVMCSDIYGLQMALEAEGRRRKNEKAEFQAFKERWYKEKQELTQRNDELKSKFEVKYRLQNEDIGQLKHDLQQARDERDSTESKLKSLENQRGFLERDIDLIRTQLQQQSNEMVTLRHEHEKDMLVLQTRNSDFYRDSSKSWSDKCDELTNEINMLRRTLEGAVRDKDDAASKAASLEKKLGDMQSQLSLELSSRENELSTVNNKFQVASSKLSTAQDENSKLKEMIGLMRKDMDLMISLKPQDTPITTKDGKLEEILCNVLTTVRDKLNWSEKTMCSVQLDNIVGSVNDLKSSVIAMNSFQSQEHDQRYQHLYTEFLIILDERNRLVEISNQLQAEIQQVKLKVVNVNEGEPTWGEYGQFPDESEAQGLEKSLWTNAMRVLPPSSTLPPKSTDRITESQRKVRRRMQREQMRKLVTNPSQKDINIRNWNKKED